MGATSLDIVARSADGLSMTMVAERMTPDRLALRGVMIDREVPGHIDATINVTFPPELVGVEAHIERSAQVVIVATDRETTLNWVVETSDLGDGYALHDARVPSHDGDIRAFAIDDLLLSAGAGLAVAVGGLIAWRSHKRQEQARADVQRRWNECLERGGTPTIEYGVEDAIKLDQGGVRIGSAYRAKVRCELPAQGSS